MTLRELKQELEELPDMYLDIEVDLHDMLEDKQYHIELVEHQSGDDAHGETWVSLCFDSMSPIEEV